MFEKLTAFIPQIANDSAGEWVFDKEHKGTEDDPMHMPFVHYSEVSMKFIVATHEFADAHPHFQMHDYSNVVDNSGVLKDKKFSDVDVSELDATTVLCLIMYIVRRERFCEGLLHAHLKDGTIAKWLMRLAELDEAAK